MRIIPPRPKPWPHPSDPNHPIPPTVAALTLAHYAPWALALAAATVAAIRLYDSRLGVWITSRVNAGPAIVQAGILTVILYGAGQTDISVTNPSAATMAVSR